MQSSALIDGKYQLVRCLGEGGMGAVYEGKHLGTGRRVAVKLVSPEVLAKGPEVAERFRREAMASGEIESQYIAHVMDTGLDPQTGSPYIVMELLVGEDLEHALRRLRRLTPDLALRIAAQACMGLQKAHEVGVIHRDVKPANLFLTRRDDDIVVKLLDFGIAKVRLEPLAAADADRTGSGMMLGSPLYMSPEQARGKKSIDHRSDIFSLGVVLYEMLSGKPPHAKADTIGDLIVRICGEAARPVHEVAPSVNAQAAAIVHKALALDPAARFASAAEMLAAIRALVPGGLALDARRSRSPISRGGGRRRRLARARSALVDHRAGSRRRGGRTDRPHPLEQVGPRPEVGLGGARSRASRTSSKSDSGQRAKEVSTGSGNRAKLTEKSVVPAARPSAEAAARRRSRSKGGSSSRRRSARRCSSGGKTGSTTSRTRWTTRRATSSSGRSRPTR